jgi:uncharacterized protein (DUF2235 family)
MENDDAPRNLVICSDGTGNTFAQHSSNVSSLVRALDLAHHKDQIAFYDQGIGTTPSLVEGVKAFKNSEERSRGALEILEPPKVSIARPLAKLAGLTVGYGLYANLREMYQALAKAHNPVTDLIFLFGFSRGAFTVRALAGLIYRCGLPVKQFADDDQAFGHCFSQAYQAYKPHCEDWVRIDRFRKTYQAKDVDIHFLGIWDTVKSYGGVRPQSLPHLRHNPAVRNVRHAVALDERRSWFQPTSWGGVDGDATLASTIRPDPRYGEQDTKEVLFTGCHSDIGGGDEEAQTARITFRWMMGEATNLGLLLDPRCDGWIFEPDEIRTRPAIHESYGPGWWVSDLIPRWELDNSTRPPGYPFKWPGRGRRCAENFRRGGDLHFHSTVGVTPVPGIRTVDTLPRLPRDEAAEAQHKEWERYKEQASTPSASCG